VRVLIFGASGSAGGGVLRACLDSPHVTHVRAVVRQRLAVTHQKLEIVTHADYADYTAIASAFGGVDACLWCLGKSSTQVPTEAGYRRLTYDYALAAARALRAASPAAVFHFISGKSTRLDSRYMWARVKAETERDLIAAVDAVCWRPGAIDGVPSGSEPLLFRMARPVVRVAFGPFRSLYVRAGDIGLAMIQATREGLRASIVENAGIRDLADAARRDASPSA
jgi:uncharacterized protein YbjT (DUF2867 family)